MVQFSPNFCIPSHARRNRASKCGPRQVINASRRSRTKSPLPLSVCIFMQGLSGTDAARNKKFDCRKKPTPFQMERSPSAITSIGVSVTTAILARCALAPLGHCSLASEPLARDVLVQHQDAQGHQQTDAAKQCHRNKGLELGN